MHRLLAALESREGAPRAQALREYADATLTELDVTEQLVAALYPCMAEFPCAWRTCWPGRDRATR
jgi:hypothetical protein